MKRVSIDKQYFIERTTITETHCWEWKGCINRYGYGKFKNKGISLYAHRKSYEVSKGDVPEGLFVCHTCDNRKCCNPEHLFLGTHQDNMDDMNNKGRQNSNPETLFKIGNKSSSKKIQIDGIVFESYSVAGSHFGITGNGVKKRFKGKIIVL